MRHLSSQSPARQKVVVIQGVATATALSSRLRAMSNAGSSELQIQLQLPAAIDNTVADSVVVDSVAAGDVVAGGIAIAVAIADGVAADVAGRQQPNKLLLPYNRHICPPVAADAIAVPVPVALQENLLGVLKLTTTAIMVTEIISINNTFDGCQVHRIHCCQLCTNRWI